MQGGRGARVAADNLVVDRARGVIARDVGLRQRLEELARVRVIPGYAGHVRVRQAGLHGVRLGAAREGQRAGLRDEPRWRRRGRQAKRARGQRGPPISRLRAR